MAAIIINGQPVAADPWQRLEQNAGIEAVPAGDVIVPLKLWQSQRDALLARKNGRLGIWLDGADDPEAIANDLAHFALIAINFPAFTDGRGYSIARLLRERYGWKGELRAIGDVLPDQVFYLSRVGFNALALRPDKDVEDALAALKTFSEAYQTSVDQPQPLFRRRIAAGAK